MKQYLFNKMKDEKNIISLFKEEKEYLVRHELVNADVRITELEENDRFADAYIERCDKESEKVLEQVGHTFLQQPITYLKSNRSEFIYLESEWYELLGVDAVSIEVDDVFNTYDVMLGLKLQKKFEPIIKEKLSKQLEGEESSFDLLFSSEDGLWNVNIDLNGLANFSEELSIGEVYNLIYQFLFSVLEEIEEDK